MYQCPFGLKLHFYLLFKIIFNEVNEYSINALSGWNSISTRKLDKEPSVNMLYQCPFGLELHFYINMSTYMTAKQVEYQCPFGLVLHFYWNDEFEEQMEKIKCINALSGWGSISTKSCAK